MKLVHHCRLRDFSSRSHGKWYHVPVTAFVTADRVGRTPSNRWRISPHIPAILGPFGSTQRSSATAHSSKILAGGNRPESEKQLPVLEHENLRARNRRRVVQPVRP